MKREVVFNRYIQNKWNMQTNYYMKFKIDRAKPQIDTRCPESFDFFKNYLSPTERKPFDCK